MSPETLLRQFDVMVDAPNGVQKLRELILQLAVRGKLVPQDSSDEPAAVLVERIAAEKQRLFKEGKIGKPKPLPPVIEDELPFEVPQGWAWTRLEALGQINPRNHLPDELVVSFCPMALLPEKYGGAVEYEERPWGEIKTGYTHFAESDVVVAKITPCFQNGKAAVMRYLKGAAGAGTTELHVFRPTEGTIIPEYVLVFLKSPGFVEGGIETMTGTAGQQRVSKDYFATTPFPLPPLPEQRRIIAKVDELMALCDRLEARQQRRTEARARLNRSALRHLTTATDDGELATHWQRLREHFHLLYDTPETVTELRQAVLQVAVHGKLVPQDSSDESAAVLLERIAAEKQRLFEEGKIGKPKPLPSIGQDEVPFEVPEGWVWVRLGIVAVQRLGKMLDKGKNKGSPYPYLRNTNVQWLRFDLADIKEMRFQPDELDEYEVRAGDLLICEGGEPGRGAVWSGSSGRMMFQKALHRVRPYCDVSAWYILYNLQANAQSGALAEYFTGATIKHMTGQSLARFVFPLPPLPEQRRIVAKVDELMAHCDALEAQLMRAREKSAHLAASVVHHLSAA